MSLNMALVRYIYPRDLLGRGIGINAMVVAVSAAVGPTVAAAILAVGTWPYLFAVNIPLGIAALAIGWRCLPHTLPASHAFDWQSAALSAVTFGLSIALLKGASLMGVDSAQIDKWEPETQSRILQDIHVGLEDKLLEPPPIQTFSFKNFQDAFDVMNSRGAFGKVVVEMI